MLIFIILIVILFIGYKVIDSTVENHKPWIQGFDLKFSSDEFYAACEAAIKRREIPGISFSRARYSEGGLTSANRTYLHIVRGEHIYDICAAPFGSGFFVSSWYVEKPDVMKKLLRKIPALEPMIGRRTYFQIDTDAMFKSLVHQGMLEAIDQMTASKGARTLNEFERRLPN